MSLSLDGCGGGASPLFKVEGQEGLAFGKSHRIAIGFRHLCFDDFHQLAADREIVNVLRFKVSHLVGSTLDFLQKIGDLVAHHPGGTCIAVHEQGPRGGEFGGEMKLGIQIHKSPVVAHAQQEILTIHRPKRWLIPGVEDIGRGGNGIRAKFLAYIGSQTKRARTRFDDPPHLQGQLFSPLHLGHLTRVIHIRSVQHQIPLARPLKGQVQLGTIVLGQLAFGDDAIGSFLLVASGEGFEKLMSRRQQVLSGHVLAQEGEFSTVMVQSVVVDVQHALVPSHVQQRILGRDKAFSHGRDGGQGQTDQAHLPIRTHKSNGARQPVFETMGLVVGKLVLVVLAQEGHVERMRRRQRHDLFLVVVFFLVAVMAPLGIQLLYLSGHPCHLTNTWSFCSLSTFSMRNKASSANCTFCKSAL